MIRLVDVLVRTDHFLRARGCDSPRLEAELLVGHVLGLDRVQLYLNHDRPMTDPELDALRPLVGRRGRREPLAYILGHKGFHDIELEVGPGVLVPRPDTETLVEAALEHIPETADPVYVADVGCGSGAIGLALAKARAGVRVYATDLSSQALALTKRNAARLGLADRVAVLRGDLLDPVPASRPIDWVVSNPPYVPTSDLAGLAPEIREHEPEQALDGGPEGLDVYLRLLPAAVARARAGVLVEVGVDQHRQVRELLGSAGIGEVWVWNDLGGTPRVVGGRTAP